MTLRWLCTQRHDTQETAEALGEISLVRARVDCCPHGKDKGFCFLVQSPVETAFLAADKEDVRRAPLFLSSYTSV